MPPTPIMPPLPAQLAQLRFAYTQKININDMFQLWTHYERVHFQEYNWTDLWAMILQVVANKRGVEVTEIGSTWLGTLVEQKALRPFGEHELKALRDTDILFNSCWQSTRVHGDERLWAIPFTVDTRMIYYWSDMLEDAGVEPETAFTTPEKFVETLETLQRQFPTPWAVTTSDADLTLHNIASWIWARGADFMSAGTNGCLNVPFSDPLFMLGLKDYYKLYRFMPQTREPLTPQEVDRLFAERKIAVTINGNWLPRLLQVNFNVKPTLLKRVQVALPPGPSFLGGANLAILNSIDPTQEVLALDLVDWLLSVECQTWLTRVGMLPARMDALSNFPYEDNHFLYGFMKAVQYGCSLPSYPCWGMVEDELRTLLDDLWKMTQSGVGTVDQIITRRVPPLAERLNQRLQHCNANRA